MIDTLLNAFVRIRFTNILTLCWFAWDLNKKHALALRVQSR